MTPDRAGPKSRLVKPFVLPGSSPALSRYPSWRDRDSVSDALRNSGQCAFAHPASPSGRALGDTRERPGLTVDDAELDQLGSSRGGAGQIADHEARLDPGTRAGSRDRSHTRSQNVYLVLRCQAFLFIKAAQEGGESMKIKVNVRAGASKGLRA